MSRRKFWVEIPARVTGGVAAAPTVTIVVWDDSPEHALQEVEDRLQALLGDPAEDPGPGAWKMCKSTST